MREADANDTSGELGSAFPAEIDYYREQFDLQQTYL